MSGIEVRRFQANDLDAVARLWRDSWISTGLDAGTGPSLDAHQAGLASESERDWHVHVACRGGEIQGFLAFDPQRSRLRQPFVSPAAQRSGVGTSLLEVARHEMPNGFWLRTDAGNETAKRFYARRGLRADRQVPHETQGGLTARHRWR